MYFHFNLQFDVFCTICEKSRLVGDKNFFCSVGFGQKRRHKPHQGGQRGRNLTPKQTKSSSFRDCFYFAFCNQNFKLSSLSGQHIGVFLQTLSACKLVC